MNRDEYSAALFRRRLKFAWPMWMASICGSLLISCVAYLVIEAINLRKIAVPVLDTAEVSVEPGRVQVDRARDPCLAEVEADAVRWCVAALAGTRAEVAPQADGCAPDPALRAQAVQDALGLVLAEDRAPPVDLCRRVVEAASPQ